MAESTDEGQDGPGRRRRAIRRGVFVASVLAVGTAVGLASEVADTVPYQADWYGLAEASLPALLGYIGVGLVDTYVGWSVGAVLLAYAFCGSKFRAAATGGSVLLVAFSSYTFAAYVSQLAAERALAAAGHPVHGPDVGAADYVLGSLQLGGLPLATAGGVVLGLIGFYARRRPGLLVVLALAVAMDMRRRAGTEWTTAIDGPQNYLLVAAGVGFVAWAGAAEWSRLKARRRTPADSDTAAC